MQTTQTSMICAGIDAGSRAIKIVLVDARTLEVVARGVADQGVKQSRLAEELFGAVCRDGGVGPDDVRRTVATGYGRAAVGVADTTVTEITCHAVGVRRRVGDARTVIDIGGEDSKVVRLDGDGKVRDFAMNDRCAAGTGRFLEVVARRLGVPLDALGHLAADSQTPAAISSMCVVFAETEIIGLLASGVAATDIIAGVRNSIASRVAAMAGRGLDEPVVFTGGVALVPGMDAALAQAVGRDVRVCPDPQMTGALGAAVLAAQQATRDEGR